MESFVAMAPWSLELGAATDGEAAGMSCPFGRDDEVLELWRREGERISKITQQ